MGGAGILPLRNTGRNACTTLAINFIIHLPKNLIFLLIFTKNRECPVLVMIKIIFPFILSVKRLCCLKGDENAVSRDETGRITPQKNITKKPWQFEQSLGIKYFSH